MLHSVHLGGRPKSELLQYCENTWPGLRKEWRDDQDLIPKDQFPYFHEAIAAKHWAAASDLLRLVALWNFGGVYVDTDVEIMRPDELTRLLLVAHSMNQVIMATEDMGNVCGAVIVAPPRHPFLTRMLDVYSGLKFADTFEGSGGTVNGTTLLTREVKDRTDVQLEWTQVFYPVHWTVRNMTHAQRQACAREFGSVTLHHFNHDWRGTK